MQGALAENSTDKVCILRVFIYVYDATAKQLHTPIVCPPQLKVQNARLELHLMRLVGLGQAEHGLEVCLLGLAQRGLDGLVHRCLQSLALIGDHGASSGALCHEVCLGLLALGLLRLREVAVGEGINLDAGHVQLQLGADDVCLVHATERDTVDAEGACKKHTVGYVHGGSLS